jgi:O-acetyl-ADP-ribose deacetylase (regulator of RNase III)
MVPKSTGGDKVLACRSCGREIREFSPTKYKITKESRQRGGDIPVIEGGKRKASDEERKYIIDLYGMIHETNEE